jgi:hypothetical protein
LIVCFLPLGAFTLGLYTQLDSYPFTSLQTDFYLFTTWLLKLQRHYLANFIYLNSSLISTWTLTWLGLQSWTLSWLNFFLNSVFKLNQILWSFSWLRLLDLKQLNILIFSLLGLDLNQVLYLGILLGSDSFRSPPSTWIDPFYLTQIQLYQFIESVLYKLDVPVYKKVSYPKQRSILVLHIFVLPDHLTRVLPSRVTPYLISYLDAYPDFYPRLCSIPYLSHYPEPYPSHYPSRTQACYPDFHPRLCPIPYPSGYLKPYMSRYLSYTQACYPEPYPSPTRTRTRSG